MKVHQKSIKVPKVNAQRVLLKSASTIYVYGMALVKLGTFKHLSISNSKMEQFKTIEVSRVIIPPFRNLLLYCL